VGLKDNRTSFINLELMHF